MSQVAVSNKPKTHKERWWSFHKRRPEVMDRFIEIVSELMQQGHRHYSSDGILHIVRFELNRGKKDEKEIYKINNNYSAFYSRYFLYLYPEFPKFFELRKVSSQPRKPKTIKLKSHWNK